MKTTIVLGLSVFIFWSCNNSGRTIESDAEESHLEAHVEHHYNKSDGALELNDGEKWIVNEEMKPFVAKQEELLNAHMQSGNPDYETLASQLQKQNELLIQSCTMTGKSHDELHKWLHPYMGLLVDLREAQTEDEADKLVSEVKMSLETYHSYFQ